MINISKIQTKLVGLVGFRQPYNPLYAILDSDNISSRSGLYVTDNEFVKVEFIKDGNDYNDISNANFNTYLKNKQKDAITNVVNAVFTKPDYIDRGLVYKKTSNKVNTVTLPNGFVGYRLELEEENTALHIKRVLLDFEGTGDVKILLFNSSQKAVYLTKTVAISSDHQEVVLDWVLDNTDGLHSGEWYIGYNTSGLSVKPYARDYNDASIMTEYKELCYYPIYVSGHNTETLFDLQKIDGLSDCNGLNLDITICNDYTDLVINNELLFSRAVLYSFQISLLQVVIASARSNRNERLGNDIITKMLIEIEGANDGTVKKVGLRGMLHGSLNKIREEIEKLENGYFGDALMVYTSN